MDMHRLYARDFEKFVRRRLSFQSRSAHTCSIYLPASSKSKYDSHLEDKAHPSEQDLGTWISDKRAQHIARPSSGLDVLFLMRGPPNEFEAAGESAADQLWGVGCTKEHFLQITTLFDLDRAFPHCLMSDQAYYSRHSHSQGGVTPAGIRVNLRSSQATLQDIALSATSCFADAKTAVLVSGCNSSQLKDFRSWLDVMKEYWGHPMLMPSLFFESHFRRLTGYFRDLRGRYIEMDEMFFHTDAVLTMGGNAHGYRTEVSKASRLCESINTLDAELTGLRLRITDVIKNMNLVLTACPDNLKDYMTFCGGRLTDNLERVDREIEYLQGKTAILQASPTSLLSSMWEIVALNENQVAQQISISSKRDSTVMMGITVGTLTFLPGTAIAVSHLIFVFLLPFGTIFAMPVFRWDAKPGEPVADSRFWIFLAVALPITALTLTLLFVWIFISSVAAEKKVGVRAAVQQWTRDHKWHVPQQWIPAGKVALNPSPPSS